MASFFTSVTDEQAELIKNSPVFFVGTSAPTTADISEGLGPINISPKGGTRLHIINSNCVAFLDYTGSGNETANHISAGSPITVMICSFEEDDAAIVRLYGKATITPIDQHTLGKELLKNGSNEIKLTPRQVIEIQVDKTTTSCGYGVPAMTYVRERRTVDRGRQYKTNKK
ncbi:MAG: pyridoxamine 5'-phosphate oxidase family protein [Anaerolineales bacterium]|nr:pyridoxamine 5'-phosphate oxidase family protein [Anaerolineales bacterium]